jgi:hypothetical protein
MKSGFIPLKCCAVNRPPQSGLGREFLDFNWIPAQNHTSDSRRASISNRLSRGWMALLGVPPESRRARAQAVVEERPMTQEQNKHTARARASYGGLRHAFENDPCRDHCRHLRFSVPPRRHRRAPRPDAVSQGRELFIATGNSITSLPPGLRCRFTLGTFFFDLSSVEERAAIWKICASALRT